MNDQEISDVRQESQVEISEVDEPNFEPISRGRKRCNSCSKVCPVACKKCRHCGGDFKVKEFDWESIDKMGQTNPTQQRQYLEKRANILWRKHGWDVVVFYYHKHANGDTVMTFGTPGIGKAFVGANKKSMSKAGNMALKVFDGFITEQQRLADDNSSQSKASSSTEATGTVSSPATAPLAPPAPPPAATPAAPRAATPTAPPAATPTAPAATPLTATPTAPAAASLTATPAATPTAPRAATPTAPAAAPLTATSTAPAAAPLTATSIAPVAMPAAPPAATSVAAPLPAAPCDGSPYNPSPSFPCTHTNNPHAQSNLSVPSNPFTQSNLFTQAYPSSSSNPATLSKPSAPSNPFAPSTQDTLSTSANSSTQSNFDAQSKHIHSSDVSEHLYTIPKRSRSFVSPANTSSQDPIPLDCPATLSNMVPSQEKLVAYVVDRVVNAIGVPQPQRTVLHGNPIPKGSICMLVHYAVDNVPVPIVLGDADENANLKAGLFFAFPIHNLFNYSYNPISNTASVSPFSV